MFNNILQGRAELYKFLDEIDFQNYKETPLSSVYFLINFNDHIEPIYFMHFEDAYFESPCFLMQTMKQCDVEQYVNDIYEPEYIEEALIYEKTMCRNGFHYEIECPQCAPFLPYTIEIIKVLTESECLDYLLNKKKEIEEIR